jgi:DNA polymerase I
VSTAGDIAASLRELEAGHDDIPTSILLGAGYDGEKRLAFLEFYEPTSQRIFHYYDKSGHLPYCYTKEPLEKLAFLKQRNDVVDIRAEEKMDLITDQRVLVSKIITSDPLAIGGATNERSIRNIIPAYEADIKYYENYLYDNQLQVGSFYAVKKGKVIPQVMETAVGVEEALHKTLEDSTPPLSDYIRNWALLLTQPQPEIKRVALDIEVYSPVESRIPDPERAEYQVISVALAGSDGKKVVYVLERPGLEPGPDRVPPDVEKRFFKTEPELLLSMYEDLIRYPVVLTFNGDDFDLPYLYQRSLNMNIPKESIPITRGNLMASVRQGLHIDLYKAFNNKSVQIYAFSNKYSEHTLNGVASGLLGREKVEIDASIGELPLNELAYYNYVDAELTLELTRFNNDVFMKLFVTICRISKMPLEDASRLNVSNWIRSLMVFEHRRWNALVPRREDLEGKGGASSEAIIKGKKYKGGFVVEPKPGVHFNVVVLDFASLYPSLIKVYNLSYETVRCVHPECRNNLIPETDHWVCTKRKGMTSLLIGSLRDVRVGYFKSLAKRPGLTKADKEFYNVISQALKVFLNASYGVMGYDNFALYCLPVAEATAALGRYSIGKTIEKAKELGVEVLYGDSVAGDSVVWIKEPAGVHATRIENLFDWPSGTTVDGKEYFVPRELCVLTLDDAGRAVFSPVKYVMRHLTKKKLYRLSLTNRLTLTVTEDHSLISLQPGRRKAGREKSLKFVEIKPMEVRRRVKKLISLTRVPLEKVAVRGYPKEVYEFLGSFVGSGRFQWTEGCVGTNLDGYVIPAGSDSKALVSLVGKLKEGDWVDVYTLQGSPGEIAIRGGKLSTLLIELAEASGRTQVPFFIFNESEENVASFLRGAFGLEGSLSLEEGGRAARLSSPRACIPDGIRELLWRLGMPSSTFYTVAVKKDGTSGSPLFWLEMEDAQAVFKKVGFLTPRAKRRLHKASLGGAQAEREGDFVSVGVMDVTEVKGDNYVYDLEVEGSHRFFANGILCHNTDSVFLRAPSPDQLDLILAWARKELGIDLEVDKVYRYAAFSNRKKNYAAVYPDGTLEVKGLTGKKSNIPLFIKKTFKDVLKVLSEVKNPDEFTAARENIRQMLRDTYLRLKRREIPMEDLAFHVMMSKSVDRYTENTPQHVKAAQLLQVRGREMKPGDVISFVKTTNGVGVKPVELAKPEDIDVDKYVEYMRGTFDQLLDSLGYDFDEILGATKLEDFFGF